MLKLLWTLGILITPAAFTCHSLHLRFEASSTVGNPSVHGRLTEFTSNNQIQKFKLFPILRLNPLCFSMGQYSLGDPLSLVTKSRYKLLRDSLYHLWTPFSLLPAKLSEGELGRGDRLPGRLQGHSVTCHTQFLWVFKALGVESGAKAPNFSSEGSLQPNLAR